MKKLISNSVKSILLTGFMTVACAGQLNNLESSKFGGIGIHLQQIDRQLVVHSVLENSPAEQSGLKGGDVILNVDELEMTGLKLSESVQHMRGQAGEAMELVIERSGVQVLDFSVPRISMTVTSGIYAPESSENLSVSQAQNVLQLGVDADVFLNGKSLKEESKVSQPSHLHAVEYGIAEVSQKRFRPDANGMIPVNEEGSYRVTYVDLHGRVLGIETRESRGLQLEVENSSKWSRQDVFVQSTRIR